MMTNNGWNFNNTYSLLPKEFYSKQHPVPVPSPKLILFNDDLVQKLGLDFKPLQIQDISLFLSGNSLPAGADPLAQAYAGHQFGHFTMLGDGRAILLGEHLSPEGRRWDIQLKGSGKTPYSRGGDGRAALGPMLREYIISEAMNSLGIPTTRSLAVVSTGETVFRDSPQPGAILTRVASSHIRVGTFEYLRFYNNPEYLKVLVKYTIDRHFPEIKNQENPTLELLNSVIIRQVDLIIHWLRVGFIHGVMNTDNMAISGETIDYGPCAFMNIYDPATVFSSIDHKGRYCFENQPAMAQWNLARFAETLLPLLHNDHDQALVLATEAINSFSSNLTKNWLKMMRIKLGLITEEENDLPLINELLQLMYLNKIDFTNTFRKLSLSLMINQDQFSETELLKWIIRWKDRLSRQTTSLQESVNLMHLHNPAFIPRNHKVEEALDAATNQNDFSLIHKLLNVLSQPYLEQPNFSDYQTLPESNDNNYKTFCGT